MTRTRSYLLALGTVACALSIGYVMQSGATAPQSETGQAAPAPMTVSDITNTSSSGAPRQPAPIQKDAAPVVPFMLAALRTDDQTTTDQDSAAACGVEMTATPNDAAVVTLNLSAPCLPNARVTLHHSGLMFTEVTQSDGSLRVDVPALTDAALFIASFDTGDGVVAHATVPSLALYDRVALQWRGESGLQLHAREFDAAYGSDGHIWNAAAGDVSDSTRDERGFLLQLGNPDTPEALIAEIYSFPAGKSQASGQIALTIEAEITAANCGTEVEAQTIERARNGALQAHDVSLAIPDCDSIGDFLVLKKPLQDLTVASN